MGGHNSVVEYKLPKLGVASSNLVARSTKGRLFVIRLEALEAGSIKARSMDAPSRRGNFNRPVRSAGPKGQAGMHGVS